MSKVTEEYDSQNENLEADDVKYDKEIVKNIELQIKSHFSSNTLNNSIKLDDVDFSCVICGISLMRKDIWGKCLHLKSCAKKYQISTKDLLQMIEFKDNDILDDENDESIFCSYKEDDLTNQSNSIELLNDPNLMAAGELINLSPTEWSCSKCTFINIIENVRCDMCLNSRESLSTKTSAVGNKSNAFSILMDASKKQSQKQEGFATEETKTMNSKSSISSTLSVNHKIEASGKLNSFNKKSRWKNRSNINSENEPPASSRPPSFKMVMKYEI